MDSDLAEIHLTKQESKPRAVPVQYSKYNQDSSKKVLLDFKLRRPNSETTLKSLSQRRLSFRQKLVQPVSLLKKRLITQLILEAFQLSMEFTLLLK